MHFQPSAVERNLPWHRLQRRLAQDLPLRNLELTGIRAHYGLRADRACWLLRAYRNEAGQGILRDGRPRKAA